MRKKRHSGIFQAFWPMKVEAKSAKHVINIASEATSKNNVQGISAEIKGTWDGVWILMATKRQSLFAYFTPVSKQKRSNKTDSSQGLVDDIERKTFYDYIVEMLLCFVFAPIYCVVFVDGIE